VKFTEITSQLTSESSNNNCLFFCKFSHSLTPKCLKISLGQEWTDRL